MTTWVLMMENVFNLRNNKGENEDLQTKLDSWLTERQPGKNGKID